MSLQKTLLSDALKLHYNEHDVDIEYIASSGVTAGEVRFIRLNPRFDVQETLKLLGRELGEHEPIPITWLRCESSEIIDRTHMKSENIDMQFFSIPATFALAQSPCYRSGRIYGMDVSSGAAISALLLSTGENDDDRAITVLDLCCSPGLKLCAIVDILEQKLHLRRQRGGNEQAISDGIVSSVVGVDVSPSRINLCKNVLQKYLFSVEASVCNKNQTETLVQLFCADGTTFGLSSHSSPLMSLHGKDLVFDSRCFTKEEKRSLLSEAVRDSSHKRKRKNKSARARERRSLRVLVSESNGVNDQEKNSLEGSNAQEATSVVQNQIFFDRVLVDAECSTDGSLKHLEQKIRKSITNKSNDSVENMPIENETLGKKEKLSELVNLQRKLILSGFRLLKSGGVMVYSTCSLSKEQNEDVVLWLLEEVKPNAFILPVSFPDASATSIVKEGFLEGTVRFKPCVGVECSTFKVYGGGFFLAKLGKL